MEMSKSINPEPTADNIPRSTAECHPENTLENIPGYAAESSLANSPEYAAESNLANSPTYAAESNLANSPGYAAKSNLENILENKTIEEETLKKIDEFDPEQREYNIIITVSAAVVTINFVYFYCGAVLILIGTHMSHIGRDIMTVEDGSYYKIVCGLSFVVGFLLIFSSLLGYYVAFSQRKTRYHNLHLIILLLAYSILMLGVIQSFAWRKQIEANLKTGFYENMKHYKIDGQDKYTVSYDYFQTKFRCCGVHIDDKIPPWHSWGVQHPSVFGPGRKFKVPSSCCNDLIEATTDIKDCMEHTDDMKIYSAGCFKAVKRFIRNQENVILGAALILTVFLPIMILSMNTLIVKFLKVR